MVAARKGIDNTPGAGEIKNLENVCYEILEPVRAHFDKPIMVSSGYRSEALCEAIGSKYVYLFCRRITRHCYPLPYGFIKLPIAPNAPSPVAKPACKALGCGA